MRARQSIFRTSLGWLAMGLSAGACFAPASGVEFDHVVALGDSLFRDGSGERSPLAPAHVADRLGAPLTNLAQGGATSNSLLNAGQHTMAAAQFGAGDLALLWIGGNDFRSHSEAIADGSFGFLDTLEANVDTAVSTLRNDGLSVAVFNLPDMSKTPEVLASASAATRANFAAATTDWNARLSNLVMTHGATLVDIYSLTETALSDPTAFSVLGRQPVGPPQSSCFMCVFHDNVHPSAVTQGFVANQVIETLNAEFDSGGAMPLALLTQTELAVLAGVVVGDLDGDTDVDAADYAAWEVNFNVGGATLADGNGDLVVNAADYTVWRDNWGGRATAGSRVVPEPDSATLVVVTMLSLLRTNRRQLHRTTRLQKYQSSHRPACRPVARCQDVAAVDETRMRGYQ